MKIVVALLVLFNLIYANCIDKLKEKSKSSEYTKEYKLERGGVNIQNITDILKKEIFDKTDFNVTFAPDIKLKKVNLQLEQMPIYNAFNSISIKYGLTYECLGENKIFIKNASSKPTKRTLIELDYNITENEFESFLNTYNLKERFHLTMDRDLIFEENSSLLFVDIDDKYLEEFTQIVNKYMEVLKNKNGLVHYSEEDTSPFISEFIQSKLSKNNFNYFYGKYIKSKFNDLILGNNLIFDENLSAIYIKTTQIKLNEFKKLLNDYERLKNISNEEMNVTIIPLKYINATGSEMGLEGAKKATDLEETLRNLIGTNFVGESNQSMFNDKLAYIKIDTRTNSIIVKDYPSKIEKLKEIVAKLDKPIELIDIEVLILSGNDNFQRGFGVNLGGGNRYNVEYLNKDWRNNTNLGKYGFATSSSVANNINEVSQIPTQDVTVYQEYTPNPTPSPISSEFSGNSASNIIIASTPEPITYESATTTKTLDGVNAVIEKANAINLLNPLSSLGLSTSLFFINDKKSFQVQIDAFEDKGDVKVLSNPHIVTLDHRKAKILSGKSVSVPIVTDEKMKREEVESGISIEVTPHIIKKDANFSKADIMLKIKVEKSSLNSATTQNIEKTQNTIDSYVIMKNNQTLVLGGLFDYIETKSNGGIPLLKDIPLFGKLFSTENKSQDKNELLFFITPKVVTQNDFNDTQNSEYLKYKDSKYKKYSKELNYMTNRIEGEDVNKTVFDKKEEKEINKELNLSKYEKMEATISIDNNSYGE